LIEMYNYVTEFCLIGRWISLHMKNSEEYIVLAIKEM
jgi:hypothetical protein